MIKCNYGFSNKCSEKFSIGKTPSRTCSQEHCLSGKITLGERFMENPIGGRIFEKSFRNNSFSKTPSKEG
jgi:hypothetical protein